MLKYLTVLAALLPTLAWAQQPQQPLTPAMQAAQSTIIELTGQKLEWQARAIELTAEVAALRKQIEDAKAAKPAEAAPKP